MSFQSRVPAKSLKVFVSQMKWHNAIIEWKEKAVIKDNVKLAGTSEPDSWFCQPEMKGDQPCLYIPDAHHLLTNTRTKVCSSGMKEAGIKREAWLCTAKSNKTPLNIAMVEDLIDKQRNSFAQTTFCEEVETIMRKLGYVNEAYFCHLIRNWYVCVDEPGVPATKRVESLLELRHWLLSLLHVGKFPPPGRHIMGVPVTLWEGYMVSIERMFMLWGLVSSYNVRSLGTLDVENFFSRH
jgi:hypothetical protein